MAILCLGATDKPQELDGVVLPQELVDDVIRRLVRFIPTYGVLLFFCWANSLCCMKDAPVS